MKKATIYAGLLIGVASLVALPLPSSGQEAAQNLSVPAILVGDHPGIVGCGTESDPSVLVPPTGEPLTGYEVAPDAYFWVQKVHKWQAQCFYLDADTASAKANWGDNLSGSASLKVGTPIRVELVLTNEDVYSATMQGYDVIKLQPSLLDRLSAYGHQAKDDGAGSFIDQPKIFPQDEWVVHDAGITFSVQNLDTLAYVVPQGTSPTAEINATGKVVYGYNLRVGTAGKYRIQFTTSPNVKLTGADAGEFDEDYPNIVSIDIDVTPGGSGGGGGGSGGGGGGGPGGGGGGGGGGPGGPRR